MPTLHAALVDLPLLVGDDPPEGLPRFAALEGLLSRADPRSVPADWRRWAAELAGLRLPPGDLPLARGLARRAGLETGTSASWLIATPVHLVAGLTRVHLHPRGALDLPADVAVALAARFAAEWRDPSLALHAVPGAGLLLACEAPLDVATTDPAAFAGHDLARGRPRGPHAGRLERLMTELQMWLHAAPPRSTEGLPVNGLWLWGGGRTDPAEPGRWPLIAADDAPLAALADGAPDPARRLEAWSLGALVRDGHGIADADAAWFEPLARALATGVLTEAELHVGARAFALRPAQRFRLWRRRRPWWEQVA